MQNFTGNSNLADIEEVRQDVKHFDDCMNIPKCPEPPSPQKGKKRESIVDVREDFGVIGANSLARLSFCANPLSFSMHFASTHNSSMRRLFDNLFVYEASMFLACAAFGGASF